MPAYEYNHLSAKSLVKALGNLTLNGSIGNAYVTTERFDKLMYVINSAALTGTLTITVTGNSAADGSGTHYTIKTGTYAGNPSDLSLEVDSEEVGYAQDQNGVNFASVVVRLTGTNTNTVKAAVQVCPLYQREDLTATGTGTIA